MPTAPSSCWIETEKSAAVMHLAGAWRLATLQPLALALADSIGQLPPHDGEGKDAATALVLDGQALEHIDTAGALLVLAALQDSGRDVAALELRDFDASHRRIVEAVRERLDDTRVAAAPRASGTLARVGRATTGLGVLLGGHIEFLGRTLAAAFHALSHPRALRLKELFAQLGQVGVQSIPVVALVTFLIGVVMAYMLGLQAEKYGANIFVVDGVALGITREFSPLIVATIMAGRSGAAFTAQLGTMKLTEEIDAIRTLGLDAMQVLVLPRVLALVITLPLLVFVGNVAGLAGSMLMAAGTLDISPQSFLDRLHIALSPRHYLIGLAKAPVFALFIAVIGCRMGLSVSRDTRSIGINTTSTVVQGIVAVILIDALFAVVLQAVNL
jgi:phospholipid/cholesterol/gamma-HCH transport system permease protein